MIRRMAALVLVLLVYLLITGFLAEGVIRLARLAPPAESPGYFWQTGYPRTGWTLQPNATGRWFNPMFEYDQMIEINSQGLRSPEVCTLATAQEECQCNLPPGMGTICDRDSVLRIMVLGDSYVEALHVPLEATFGQQIGAHLTNARLADGRRVEVVNVGVSGWGTDQQLLWLREMGYQYTPDIILLAFYPGNDFLNNHMALEFANFGGVRKPWFQLEAGELVLHDYPYDGVAARESIPQFEARLSEILSAPGPDDPQAEGQGENLGASPAGNPWLEPVGRWLADYSALYRYVEPRIRVSAPGVAVTAARWGLISPGQETSDQAMGAGYIPVTYGVYQEDPAPVWQESFALTGALLAELQAEADRLGAELAAVVLTAPEQVNPERWEQELARYPAMATHEWRLEQPTQIAMELLAQAGIPTLNLLPIFREAAARGADLHFRDDGHWNATGHEFAGALSANFLVVQGFTTLGSGATVPVVMPTGSPHLFTWLLWFVVAVIVFTIAWSAYQNGPINWLRGAWAGLGTTAELFVFTLRRGQYVVLPLLVVLILFGGLLLIAQSSVVGPFIYPLF